MWLKPSERLFFQNICAFPCRGRPVWTILILENLRLPLPSLCSLSIPTFQLVTWRRVWPPWRRRATGDSFKYLEWIEKPWRFGRFLSSSAKMCRKCWRTLIEDRDEQRSRPAGDPWELVLWMWTCRAEEPHWTRSPLHPTPHSSGIAYIACNSSWICSQKKNNIEKKVEKATDQKPSVHSQVSLMVHEQH